MMYQLVELYKGEVIELRWRLHELIQTSDEPLTLHINWRDMEVLGPHSIEFFEAPLASSLDCLRIGGRGSAFFFNYPYSLWLFILSG